MRRRRPSPEQVPERFARFVPVEWPGHDLDQRLAAWRTAKLDWVQAHGGSMVEAIKECATARRAVYGIPPRDERRRRR